MTRRIPHLKVPFALDRQGHARTTEQDSGDEIRQSVKVLLATRPGERLVIPDYGLADPAFAGPDAGVIAEAVQRWEPRADLGTIQTAIDDQDPGLARVTVPVEPQEDL